MGNNSTESTSKELVGQSNLEQEEIKLLEKRIDDLLKGSFSDKKISTVADILLDIERSLDKLGTDSELADKAEELFSKMLIEMTPDGEKQIKQSLKELEIQEKEEMRQLKLVFQDALQDIKDEKEYYKGFDTNSVEGKMIMEYTMLYDELQDKGINSLTDKQIANLKIFFNNNTDREILQKQINLVANIISVLSTKKDVERFLDDTNILKDIYDTTKNKGEGSQEFENNGLSNEKVSKYRILVYNQSTRSTNINNINITYDDLFTLYSGDKKEETDMLINIMKQSFYRKFGLKERDILPIVDKIKLNEGVDIEPVYTSIMSSLESTDKTEVIMGINGNLSHWFTGFDSQKDGLTMFRIISKCKKDSFIMKWLEKGDSNMNLFNLLMTFSLDNIKAINKIGEKISKTSNPKRIKDLLSNMNLNLYGKDSVESASKILYQAVNLNVKNREEFLPYIEFTLYGKEIYQQELRLTDEILSKNIEELLKKGKFKESSLGEITEVIKRTYKSSYNSLSKNDNIAKKLPNEFLKTLLQNSNLEPEDKHKLERIFEEDGILEALLFARIDEKKLRDRQKSAKQVYEKLVSKNTNLYEKLTSEEKQAFARVIQTMDTNNKSHIEIVSLIAEELVYFRYIKDYPVEAGDSLSVVKQEILQNHQTEVDKVIFDLKKRLHLSTDDINKIFQYAKTLQKEQLEKDKKYQTFMETTLASYDDAYDAVVSKSSKYNTKDTELKQKSGEESGDVVAYSDTQISEEGMSIISTEDENGLYITNFTIPEEYTASGDATTMEIKATSHVETSQKILENYVSKILGLDIDLKGTLDSFVRTTGIQISDKHPIGLEDIAKFNTFMTAFVIQNIDKTTLEINNINYDRFINDLIHRPMEVLPLIGKLIKRGENVLSDTLEYKDQAYRFNFIGKESLHNLQAKEVIREAKKVVS